MLRRNLRRLIFCIIIVCCVSAISVMSAFAQQPRLDTPPENIIANPDTAPAISRESVVERLLPNDALLGRRDYRQVNGAVEIFDTPNGTVTASYPPGTYFVSVQRVVDGWAEINDGQWMRAAVLTPAPISRFGGVLLHGELTSRMGWLRQNVRPSAVPGIEPDASVVPLMRYTLITVRDSRMVGGVEWLQIGTESGAEQWIPADQAALINPPNRPADVDTERWVAVDVSEQIVYAYEGDEAVFAALTSTGVETSPTTTGLYHVYVRYHETIMSRGVRSDPWFYYIEDVPYTMYFNDHMALHGAYWHDGFGEVRSHGCVNLSLTDAYWLYNFLAEEFDFTNPADIYPAIYVYESGGL